MTEKNIYSEGTWIYNFIIIVATSVILAIESLIILFSLSKKGVVKKETLSTGSDMGFDVKIIMKKE